MLPLFSVAPTSQNLRLFFAFFHGQSWTKFSLFLFLFSYRAAVEKGPARKESALPTIDFLREYS